jgi:hypothetical protein
MASFFQHFPKSILCQTRENKSNGSKSKGVGNTRHQSTTGRGSNDPNKERSDVKQGTDKKGSTGRSSNSGRKAASGGGPS